MLGRLSYRVCRRAVSNTAAPGLTPALSDGPSRSSLVNDFDQSTDRASIAQLKAVTALETPMFSPLGSPAAMLSINAPASVPVYIRRRSLTAVYGVGDSSAEAVSNKLVFLSPMARFLSGLIPFTYQKLVSTRPFSLLVSSGSGRAFASLTLDGSSDWALVNKSCLQAYAGPALSVSMHMLPTRVSASLARTLKVPTSTRTGLFSWFGPGYTVLAGRGHVGITGCGSVYSVSVASGEHLVVRRKNLLAVSVAGPFDLNNCISVHEWSQLAPEVEEVVPTNKRVTLRQAWNSKVSPLEKARMVWGVLSLSSSKLWAWLKYGLENLRARFAGDTGLVSVMGPRQIMIQASADQWHFPQMKSGPATNSVLPTSEDRLSYVTIDPRKGAVFKNTLDFSDTVQRIHKDSN